MLSIWMFLIVPLTFLGTLTGRALSSQGNFPTRGMTLNNTALYIIRIVIVNPIPRPIPEKVWYTEPLTIMLIGGLLPFGSIFIEMYFVFTSFWAYKIYYVYGFMLLVLIILCVVTACVAIVGAYFLLNSEDHRWHWTCFLAGGSISVYVYLYAIYYYFNRTKMYGLFQTVYYFGYTAIVCSGLMLMCGAVGYVSVNLFIRRIYSTVKID